MQYVARVKKDGRHWGISFPDAEGCVTFAERKADVEATAAEALVSWLVAEMVTGQVPPVPRARMTAGAVLVKVPTRLAVAVRLRQARAAAGLSQAELAERVGVSQQQVAKLESSKANPSLDTLAKVAKALGMTVDIAFAA